MSNKKMSLIKDLKPYKDEWRLTVKLLHSWKQSTSFGGDTLECILVDESSDKIQASCKKSLMVRVQRYLPIGEWKVIDTFKIGGAGGQYRPTKQQYKMTILTDTMISRLDYLNDSEFLDLATYEEIGVLHDGYKKACSARGLLDDDHEYIDDLLRISYESSASNLHEFFSTILLNDSLESPENVWEHTWECLSEDIEHRRRKCFKRPGLVLSDEEKKNYALQEIEILMRRNGDSLERFTKMPKVSVSSTNDSNVLILDDRSYPRENRLETLERDSPKMTDEQKKIFHEIIDVVTEERGGTFFVYGFGGTGKTFLWNLLSAAIRSRGDIVLNVASSGIASLLLQGGRTAHSRFSIPLNPDEFSSCNMAHGTDQANLVKEASLIIWDEAPMMNKHCFEALDRSLSDIVG
ncbi:hypothetical protein Bca4012_010033 [Brassica carinata]